MKNATVKDLKEYLKQFPDDTEIEVLKEENTGYMGAYITTVPLDLNEYSGNVEFMDFTTIDIEPDHRYYGKKLLIFGDK